MSPVSVLILLGLVGSSLAAVNCYQSIWTSKHGEGEPMPQVVYCPNASFCFKSLTRRDNDAQGSSVTITRSCGDTDESKCFEAVCNGHRNDKQCCCVGDLCNGQTSLLSSALLALTIPLVHRLL